MRSVSQWLRSDKVLVRLAALWLICALLFTAAWTASYYLLPEGILRGKLAGQYIPVETPHVITTFLRILGVNLLAGCGLVTLANLCRVGDMSLGYQIVMFHAVLYGILLGTNSFGLPAPARFAPSLTTVLNRSGAFEITAYIAIAAATRRLTIWRQRSWLDWHSEQVGSWRAWQLNRAEIAVIVGAVLLLAAANYREAVQMHQLLCLAVLANVPSCNLMTRPRPTVSSPNEHDAYLGQAQAFAQRFAAHEGVVGVLLIGGVARGYADHFSELDLAVYLTRRQFESWTRRGLAPFPEGDSCLDGWHVDFDYLCYKDEREANWDHVKRWDRSYAVILYDPQGLMQEMLAQKAALPDEEKRHLTSRYLVLYGEYFCSLVVPSWVHRGDLLAAHHCLNTALDGLVRAVFLANDELIPFEKWTLNLSYTLDWTPRDWRARLEEALLVREISRADVERRCALICDLFAECREKLLGPKREGLDIVELRKLDILRAVRQQGRMSAAEFDRRFGLRQAIQSPLFHLLRRETPAGEEWLVFDEERLQKHGEQCFESFLGWDRALLRVLSKEVGCKSDHCVTEP